MTTATIDLEHFDSSMTRLNMAIMAYCNKIALYTNAIRCFSMTVRLWWGLYREKRQIKKFCKNVLNFPGDFFEAEDKELIKRSTIVMHRVSTSMEDIHGKWETDTVPVLANFLFPRNISARISMTMMDIIEISEDTSETLALSIDEDFVKLVMKETDDLSKN